MSEIWTQWIVIQIFFVNKNMKLYYIAPPQEVFQEMKTLSLQLWKELDDPYDSYEKSEQIERMHNIKDNFMFILAMFDDNNQSIILSRASEKLKTAVRIRIASVNK